MATIHDVAQLAGVSIKTVSRVINDEPSIRDTTRAKVEAAIKKLEYRPHAGARAMRSSKSGLIGMITGVLSAATHDPLESGLSAMHLVRAVQEGCRRDGRILMIADSPGSSEEVADLLRKFQSHRVEGVIYAADYHQQVLFPHSENFPLVLANCFDAMHTPAVVPDDAQGQEIATRYLIEQGHRRLAYVGLPDNLLASRLRLNGFLKGCREGGLDDRTIIWRQTMEFEPWTPFADLQSILDELLTRAEPPTAFCFGNDLMAMRAMAYFKERSIRIPDDISVIGYDNDEMLIRHMEHALTTVTLPYQEIGLEAYRCLNDILQGKHDTNTDRPRRIPSELIQRGTVSRI